jgi:hypothetical protein
MGRRRFLMLAIFAAAATATWQALVRFGSWWAGPEAPPFDPSAAIKAIVRKKLPYVQVADDQLERFAYDFRLRSEKNVLALATTSPDDFVYEVCAKFLMSSDFFFNGANVTRPVRYVVWYDPYKACSSPFAKMI